MTTPLGPSTVRHSFRSWNSGTFSRWPMSLNTARSGVTTPASSQRGCLRISSMCLEPIRPGPTTISLCLVIAPAPLTEALGQRGDHAVDLVVIEIDRERQSQDGAAQTLGL